MTSDAKPEPVVPLPAVVAEDLSGLINKYAVDGDGHVSQVVGYRSFANGTTWIFVLTGESMLTHIPLGKVEKFLHRPPRV